MQVISASRRTDIAAFYAPWLLNRLRAGWCEVLNPYNRRVSRVSLLPEDVLGLVLWTRNPGTLLSELPGLLARGYHIYLQMTITGYPRAIERANPPLALSVERFRRVAAILTPDLTHWRYDPIVLSDATPPAYHLARFAELCRALAGATHRCTISLLDRYAKTERNLGAVTREHGIVFGQPSVEEQRDLVHALRDIAAPHGIALHACCEDALVGDGIAAARCIDGELIRSLRPEVAMQPVAAPTRAACGCVRAVDIGAYDSCGFGCAYCYATTSQQAAQRRYRAHDPTDPLLWRPTTVPSSEFHVREAPQPAP